jgi:hypothetical protein
LRYLVIDSFEKIVYYVIGVVLIGLGAATIDWKASKESQDAAITFIKVMTEPYSLTEPVFRTI